VVDEVAAAKAARSHEHLIVDTAARPDIDTLKALIDSCDHLVIPTTPDGLSFDALMLTVAELRKLDSSRFRVLVTMSPPKPARDGEIAQEALAGMGVPVFGTTIRSLKAFRVAGTSGVLVNQVKDLRANLGWWDYQAVGDELIGLLGIEHHEREAGIGGRTQDDRDGKARTETGSPAGTARDHGEGPNPGAAALPCPGAVQAQEPARRKEQPRGFQTMLFVPSEDPPQAGGPGLG
jgi:chromosome partitioning protein